MAEEFAFLSKNHKKQSKCTVRCAVDLNGPSRKTVRYAMVQYGAARHGRQTNSEPLLYRKILKSILTQLEDAQLVKINETNFYFLYGRPKIARRRKVRIFIYKRGYDRFSNRNYSLYQCWARLRLSSTYVASKSSRVKFTKSTKVEICIKQEKIITFKSFCRLTNSI